MEKNRFDSREALWTAPGAVTCGSDVKKEEKRNVVMPSCKAPREEVREHHYQYLYLEEEEEKRK